MRQDGAARNAAGSVVPVYIPAKVTDDVTISSATHDPVTGR